MRLIDADELVKKMKNTPPNAYTVGQMIYLAENAPTAFDVDKVIGKIKEKTAKNAVLHGKCTWAEDAIGIIEAELQR